MKIQFTIKSHPKNTYINSVLDNLFDLSLLFDINIEFFIIKNKKYDEKTIEIIPITFTNNEEEISQNNIDFHGAYLDKYVDDENINLGLMGLYST